MGTIAQLASQSTMDTILQLASQFTMKLFQTSLSVYNGLSFLI